MSDQNRTGIDNLVTTDFPDSKDKTAGHLYSFFLKFLIPCVVIAVGVSTLVYLALRKRRLDRLRHRLVPFYKFEPGECEDEWQTELLDEMDNQKIYSKLETCDSAHGTSGNEERYFNILSNSEYRC